MIYFLLLNFLTTILFSQDKRSFQQEPIQLELISSEIKSPIAIQFSIDSKIMYVAEQNGKIRIIESGELKKGIFLDIRNKLSKNSSGYTEKGLLGFVLHPDFKKNRKFYINYSSEINDELFDHKTIISEFQTSLSNSQKAMLRSERIILEIPQPESNHNGGTLVFGPDKYLYIGSGDGGSAGDPHGEIGNGQNLNSLLGKILRIDVDSKEGYNIPEENPFTSNNNKREIYAYGLRNPWKFSFDRQTGQLYLGDVGQNKFEEINIIQKGKNYGWRIMEGFSCYLEENCQKENLESPIHSYSRENGIAVIGGYVYRGDKKSKFFGKYIYADWSGKLYMLERKGKTWLNQELPILKNNNSNWKFINSFGEDTKGNLYLLAQSTIGVESEGFIFKLILP